MAQAGPNVEWRVSVTVAAAHAEAVQRGLAARAPGWTCWMPAGRAWARLDLHVATRSAALRERAWARAVLRAAARCPFRTRLVSVRRQDWQNAWKRYFRARKVSPRITVAPSWEPAPVPRGGFVIRIDPGTSFGTGLHPTTCGCLRLLDRLAQAGVRGSLLDMGCGSGILAVTAARLGFVPVYAEDNDPVAVRDARENARKNAVRVAVRRGDAGTGRPARHQVVVANILAGVLCHVAPNLVRRVESDGGRLILSGILTSQYPEVRRRYRLLGMRETGHIEIRGWTTGLFEAGTQKNSTGR